MKSCMLFIVISMAAMMLALVVKGQEDDYQEISIAPKGKIEKVSRKTRALEITYGNAPIWIKANGRNRNIRSPQTCRIPEKLDNSELKCKLFPSKVECNQTCIFGHTFPEGLQRTMKCKYSEDRWYPSREFENCKPFVDCNLSYGPGAYAKCYTNHMHKGPSCEVRCAHYEDKEAVPSAMYQCDIQGKWTPKLPFCVKAGSGEKLASRPRNQILKASIQE